MSEPTIQLKRTQERQLSLHNTFIRIAKQEFELAKPGMVGEANHALISLTLSALAVEALGNAIARKFENSLPLAEEPDRFYAVATAQTFGTFPAFTIVTVFGASYGADMVALASDLLPRCQRSFYLPSFGAIFNPVQAFGAGRTTARPCLTACATRNASPNQSSAGIRNA